MPPPAIVDPATLDFTSLVADRAQVEAVNPHRHEFQLLDAVVLADADRGIFAGYHDVREDAFWVRGHVPGRPLFPGVLMIESAAQLASFMFHHVFDRPGFLGFVGVEGVKFRGTVEPPSRFVVVGEAKQLRPRRVICQAQGFVDNAMVFEAIITGMPV